MELTEIEIKHADMVKVLAKSGEDLVKEMTPLKAHLNHMVIGISGEAGELGDAIKKFSMYNKTLDLENVIEELGDLEFFLEGVRNKLGITRGQTLEHNMNKLGKRYKDFKYSDKQAHDRADKEK